MTNAANGAVDGEQFTDQLTDAELDHLFRERADVWVKATRTRTKRGFHLPANGEGTASETPIPLCGVDIQGIWVTKDPAAYPPAFTDGRFCTRCTREILEANAEAGEGQ